MKRDIHEVVVMLEPLPLGKGAIDEASKRIDVIGFLCPIPIAKTREAIAEMETGEVLEVWADDPETLHDMPILLQRINATLLSVETDAGEYRYLIKAGGGNMTNDVIQLIEQRSVPSTARLPTSSGEFQIRVFHEQSTGLDHVALTLGEMSGPDPVLVRMHSECLTGDAFASLRCDCGAQLETAMAAIQGQGWGALLYLRQEGRGIGLHAKIQAYHLQDKGADTLDANLMLGLPADARDYKIAASILKALDIPRVSLLTNNPDKVEQLSKYGIDVVERMSLVAGIGEDNRSYLSTKAERMGHQLSQDELQS